MEGIALKAMRARGFVVFMCVSFAERSGLFQAPVMKAFIRTGAKTTPQGWWKRLLLLLCYRMWIVVEEGEREKKKKLAEQIGLLLEKVFPHRCCHRRRLLKMKKEKNQEPLIPLLLYVFHFPQQEDWRRRPRGQSLLPHLLAPQQAPPQLLRHHCHYPHRQCHLHDL
jgi:hypothetical protein